jgi:NAD(P)-dependent dehydrogenase (short-subunit alcohol dehydrogenase family)
LTNPEVVVFAGARQPHAATALHELEKTHQGRVHVVKLTSADEDDNRAAVAEIRKTVGRLDVVIANAGKPSSDELRCIVFG